MNKKNNIDLIQMKKEFWITCISVCLLAACCEKESLPVTPTGSDLQFNHLAKTWDEGIPLGNATVGALVWQRDSALRLLLVRITALLGYASR